MPRTLREIETEIHAFEREVELLDRDHDGHADDPRFEQRIHDIEARLQALAREFSQVLQQSRQTNAPPRQQQQNPPQQQQQEREIEEEDGSTVRQEVRHGLGVGVTMSRDQIATTISQERKFWEATSGDITVFSVGPVPIVLRFSTTGKGVGRLTGQATAEGSNLIAEVSFTAEGSVDLGANFGIIVMGGRATVECSAKSNAQVKVKPAGVELEINPFTGEINLAFRLFARLPDSIKTVADAMGIEVQWQHTLAKYNLLKVEVPKSVNFRMDGSYRITLGRDVQRLQQDITNIYNTAKQTMERITHWAETQAHEAAEAARALYNRFF